MIVLGVDTKFLLSIVHDAEMFSRCLCCLLRFTVRGCTGPGARACAPWIKRLLRTLTSPQLASCQPDLRNVLALITSAISREQVASPLLPPPFLSLGLIGK